MQIRWLGTAGFELKTESGTVLLIDPYLSRPAAARPPSPLGLADIQHADAILVTHGHFDHAFDVPALSKRLRARVHASSSVCQILAQRGAAPSQLHPLAPGDVIGVREFQIRALAARHVRFDLLLVCRTLPRLLPKLASLYRLIRDWPQGQVLGYSVRTPGLSVAHFGSAGGMDESTQGLCPDVALIPLQGRSDIVQVATQMATSLKPRKVVPHHWDDFYPPISQLIPPEAFVEALSSALPATQLHLPKLGEPWVV